MGYSHIPHLVALRPILSPIIERFDIPISMCHGDMNICNLIFEGGLQNWREGQSRISFVDWEQAGWMPSYWDALKGTWLEFEKDTEWMRVMRAVFVEYNDILDADWEWRTRSQIPIL
ncbi:hypothetical protein E1B28_012102 [Marasmius oreades]|uniref:Aminoglycoside phosphotransferase domain-containing protein n=1 Tax=Marasmius oreades TaxID=181124 RepID=A0A9P7RRT0_9AGAR|nr:uncharacterized protein E1B28_012102 [Marasmius oreades]KAG7088071.1 hypothetical protein E1B28_012102 [Marasmius oreades]